MENNNLLGEIIRRERKEQGLTQSELGNYSGTGLNFVSQLERGKATVRLDKLLDVLSVLGLELKVVRGKSRVTAAPELKR